MWKANEYLFEMLKKYEQDPHITEVLIVNNAKPTFSMQILDGFTKVRLLGKGNNLLVNPSWDMAVKQARNERVLIVNDDINIIGFPLVMNMLEKQMIKGAIYGFSPNCFESERTEFDLLPVKIEQCRKYTLTYGYGVFMALFTEDYLPIPKPMLIWFGDMYLFAQLRPYHIYGFDVLTPMSVTTKTLDLRQQRSIEFDYFEKNRHLFQKINQ